jgi:hypothetical protein
MATIVVTNISSSDVHIRDLYKTLAPGEAVSTERSAADLNGMGGLMAAMAAGTVTLGVTYSADELASGLAQAPGAIEAQDIIATQEAAGTAIQATATFAAGGGGSPADVTLYASAPFAMTIVDAVLHVSTAVAGTATLRDAAAGGGSAYAAGSTASAGRVPMPLDANAPGTIAAGSPVILRLSDDAAAGTVVVTVRRET